MSNVTAMTVPTTPDFSAIEQVLINGNIAALNTQQRVTYYNRLCESLGLNPLTKPFEYLTLQGKVVLYARKDCTEQLRKLHGVSITSVKTERFEDVFVVTAVGHDKTGRQDSSTGAVTIGNLKGDALANAVMKAETKAKRRLTLSICGLGMLDETEIETIPDAHAIPPTETCADCQKDIVDIKTTSGAVRHAEQAVAVSKRDFKRPLCWECLVAALKRDEEAEKQPEKEPEEASLEDIGGELRVTGSVSETFTTGKSFGVRIGAMLFSTFHKSHREFLKDSKGKKVCLAYEQNYKDGKTYNNISSIISIDGVGFVDSQDVSE